MRILTCLLLLPALAVAATVDDLWITEVVPSADQVEVTNVGVTPFTTTSTLPFCHRFRYSDAIPTGTTFLAGESKVFRATFANRFDTDLWLYRGGSFGVPANIITGLKWGPQPNIGRTGIATAAGKWDGIGLAVPATGMSLQLTGADPTTSSSWSIGEPELGSFALPLSRLSLQLSENEIDLRWQGGSPPFRVESSTGLGGWQDLTGLLDGRAHTVSINPSEDRRFFRVMDQAMLEESADYRITFVSLWTMDRFANVPGSAHFSGLVGGMHDESVSFWSPGMLASNGIGSMAETGSKSALLGEVNAALGAGVQQSLSGGGLGFAPSQTTLDFTAVRSHPLITITSMIAPSPDWFVGLHGQSLLQENDDWVESMSFDLLAYDAGTDSGSKFTSGNLATNPAVPVFLIPASDSNFAPASGQVGDPIPIARIIIERTTGS